ncbi:MAG: hypothetical protein ACAI38_06960 [Myxococcota bacterium]
MRGVIHDGRVLTSQLVGALRRGDRGLAFAETDIERFRNVGSSLLPDTLTTWVRELGVLAVTLRDHVHATQAAKQLERELIDPLCAVLDRASRARA